jgi:hypothetical protein
VTELPSSKSSRPLLVLGLLSFVPGIGVLFGFCACCWGLVSDRPRALRGALLGGAGMLLNFAGCAALGFWAVQRQPVPGGFRGQMAQVELSELVNQLEHYHSDHHRYPDSLRELRGPFGVPASNIYDRSLGLFNRSHLYQYRPAGDRQSYSLFSAGPDGRPDTPDDLYPVVLDSLAGHSGLRKPGR